MSCQEIREELVGFHFGTVEAEARGRVEEHLAACPACLRHYLALKREIEVAEAAPGPSEAARARLRRAVAAQVLPEPAVPRWRWWERPLAAGVAAACVLLAVGAVRHLAQRPGTAPHGISASLDQRR